MTREEARIIAAQLWLGSWPIPKSKVIRASSEDNKMVDNEIMLIRRRLQRLAKPRTRSKP